jgi:bifunctional non-homologous end joining protein LigD
MDEKTDKLLDYKQKRDFTKSPEPSDDSNRKTGSLIFVVQKHKARNLHYDFRLELEGVLKSWAVPKGPSLDPKQKRLAVQVEDHPLEYAGFEGEIPPGQYGAGEVMIWDRGTWEPVEDPVKGIEKGHLKFRLRGEKLQGVWALVQMHFKDEKKEQWLLIKDRDEYSRPEEDFKILEALPGSVSNDEESRKIPEGAKEGVMPRTLAPELATLVDRVPAGGGWNYEIKFDGYRILARIEKDDVRLFTRNGKDWTDKLKSLVSEIKELKISSGWLDGEVVMPGKDGLPDFGNLQNAFEQGGTDDVIYYIFDVPYYSGYDLRGAGLADRRALLRKILAAIPDGRVRMSEDIGTNGRDILLSACGLGMEGLVGKGQDSKYVSERSGDWIKIKCRKRQEFVIAGYTDSKRGGGEIGALLLGFFDEGGQLRYAGKVGTGFDRKTSAMLKEKLSAIETETAKLAVEPEDSKAYWVLPKMVAEVSFAEWTKDGRVRQAVFHGLRVDKPNVSVKKETAEMQVSNPDRIVDPSTGLKKIDIVNYYRLASARMLPHLMDRPVSFLRAPSGIEGEMFFQKHGETLVIPGLKQLDPEIDRSHLPLLEVDTLQALIGAAQMNVIEFHTWNATVKNIDKPDRMVFDLDPGEGISWAKVLEAAELTRTLLQELGLESFLKTSGGKGLHVFVPLKPRDDWETVKAFSKAVSEHLAKVIPSLFTAVSGPNNRRGRVFVDYIRNNRSATTVAAFSVRARPGLGVSITCSWKEISTLTSGAHWNISNVRDRLKSAEDPWADYFKVKQILSAASKRKMKLR